jgi:hypothetical protein
MKTKQLPCKDCMIIPICRHKPFHMLIQECSLISKVWHGASFWEILRLDIQTILKPTQWGIK